MHYVSMTIDIGLVLCPSMRANAYWDMMEKMGVSPREIIRMTGPVSRRDEVCKEAVRHDYARTYFDVTVDLDARIALLGVDVVDVDSRDVNSAGLHAALKSSKCRDWIFSGGGILSPDTLALGKRFLHVHPGVVPEYRGSTCFYYSLLSGFTLGATAFIMDEQLDTGNVVTRASFELNCRVTGDQPLFMDHILDPYIRACTLRKALKKIMSQGGLGGDIQAPSTTPAYYVMHPLLRHLAIHNINRRHDASRASGVSEIENEGSRP
jgi:folate-dependent phosphoribosylglycinamide formyltransferase PurN